ncbi:MAG TPA: heme-degrading domain-containing protein [Burkholderiaceae bacterium]|nr:heme-degrading domain-containing protein [Burkholderiaceae bacterium]
MDLATDITRIAEQERRLRFARFDLDTAWRLGTRLRAIAEERGVRLSIEIRLARETVFYCAMTGTTPANADWIRRKRNTVELLHRSSYGVGRSLERDEKTLEQTMGVPARDFATHGGSFPLLVEGLGCVGAVTASGAPQRQDHEIVVMALAELCGVPADEVALD